jgi:xanthine dehydrogenase accessory factor
MEYIEEIVKLFDGGENFVLATVFNSKGSAPRAAGARMLIHRDGSSLGTVGGGLLEGRVVAAAVDIFATGQSRVMEFLLTGADAAQTEMICGGEVEVLVEFCAAEDSSQAGIFRGAVEALARRQRAWMVTEIPSVTEISSKGENSSLPGRCLVRSGENTAGELSISACAGSGSPQGLFGETAHAIPGKGIFE